MVLPHNTLDLPRSLGDNLVLRLGAPADIEAVAALNERILWEEDEPPEIFTTWTRDLMSGRHPTTTAADCILVEDTAAGQIVSAAILIPQVWTYEDIPVAVGRPEMVVTDPAYRRRGLVRAVFETMHALSAAYGHHVQAITGIRWFYRQFGYEYALPLGGGRQLPIDRVPALKDNETEPYRSRPATEADVPTLARFYKRRCAKKLVASVMDERRWRYDLFEQSPNSVHAIQAYCLVDPSDRVIGYYAIGVHLWKAQLHVFEVGVDETISLYGALPTILRALKRRGETLAAEAESEKKTLKSIQFNLGLEHLLYEALDARLDPLRPPYAYYIRVADTSGFIRHIAPVLERRLADSVMRGFSGELKITFHQGGLRLVFNDGRLTEAADWQAPDTDQDWTGASFPPLVFLQLLFGYRSLDELRYAFPDCSADDEPALLLNILFPKRVSWVIPLG